MKKAILALTISAVIGSFSVTCNAVGLTHVNDYAPDYTSTPGDTATAFDKTQDTEISNLRKDVFSTYTKAEVFEKQASSDINNLAQAELKTVDALKILDSENTQNKVDISAAGSTANAANTAAGNAQHAADLAQTKADDNQTKINNHEVRIQTVEHDSTLTDLHIQGLQADIVSHGDRMNDLQNQTDTEVTRAKAAESANASTAGDAKTLAASAQTTATAANTTATQAKNQSTTNTQRIDNHEARITALEVENGTGSAFEDLKNKVDDNRKRASAAISGVAAMANIPQVIQGQTFAVGAGVGTTDGENAVAVGFSARTTEHVVVKASVSDDTQQNFVVGAGASYGW